MRGATERWEVRCGGGRRGLRAGLGRVVRVFTLEARSSDVWMVNRGRPRRVGRHQRETRHGQEVDEKKRNAKKGEETARASVL